MSDDAIQELCKELNTATKEVERLKSLLSETTKERDELKAKMCGMVTFEGAAKIYETHVHHYKTLLSEIRGKVEVAISGIEKELINWPAETTGSKIRQGRINALEWVISLLSDTTD
jgi:chromosome segregation ATPase